MSKSWKTINFQGYFIHIHTLRNQKKKNNKAKDILRCYYIRFSIFHCLLAPKKWKLKNGQRLPTVPYFLPLRFSIVFRTLYWKSCIFRIYIFTNAVPLTIEFTIENSQWIFHEFHNDLQSFSDRNWISD